MTLSRRLQRIKTQQKALLDVDAHLHVPASCEVFVLMGVTCCGAAVSQSEVRYLLL